MGIKEPGVRCTFTAVDQRTSAARASCLTPAPDTNTVADPGDYGSAAAAVV